MENNDVPERVVEGGVEEERIIQCGMRERKEKQKKNEGQENVKQKI